MGCMSGRLLFLTVYRPPMLPPLIPTILPPSLLLLAQSSILSCLVLLQGKPENQNHAVIFCFGEALQTIDMNQDNHLCEALKMRNLLTELRPEYRNPAAAAMARVSGGL